MPPSLSLSPRERRLVARLRTPHDVQRFLRDFPYNWKETLRTFRGVVEHGEAHCLEAVLFAATVLEQHGYPPLVLDLESQDKLDHVLFIYERGGRWGSVGRSRDEGLHGRKPVFRRIRDLVSSYMDPYVDAEARLVGFGTAMLDDIVRTDWRLSTRNVWSVEQALIRMKHTRMRMGDARYRRAFRRFAEFKKRSPQPTAREWRAHLAPQSSRWL